MALGSAAVIGVYAAGWFKTKDAADRFAAEAEVGERRRPAPSPIEQPREQTVERISMAPTGGTAGRNLVRDRVRARAGAAAALPTLPALTRVPDGKLAKSSPSASEEVPTLSPRGSLSQYVITPAAPVEVTPTPESAASAGSTPVLLTAPTAAPASAPVPAPASAPVPAPQPMVESGPAPAPGKQPEQAAHHAEAAAPKWKDGTYYGWGTSRHGDIQAAVIIQGGKIATAMIAQCLTRYSCSWIAALPPQVVGRQSAEVDYVSGATQSVNAFYYAVLEALARAK